ncbi:MAG TPA: tail fiber protein [Bacteroidia bacterium]|nr:tail fiber protein [Bacteroidia bacterium]
MDEFIGIIKLFAGNFAPKGWAFCSGQLLSISQNQALFAILGTTYGGDGRTTFALPDLRSRVALGGGQGGGPGLPAYVLGQRGGEPTHTLIVSEMPSHTHTGAVSGNAGLSVSSGDATQSAATAGATIATPGSGSRTFTPTLGFNTATPDTVLNAASVNTSTLAVNNLNNGGSNAHNNMQPYLGLSYIICINGLFPPHN